jgi:hypothetical protein
MDRSPLADYFWIAGVDSLSYGQDITSTEDPPNEIPSRPVSTTIDEDSTLDTGGLEEPTSGGPVKSARHSRGDSFQRLSMLSDEARDSIRIVNSPDLLTKSNRSSTTIKGVQVNNTNSNGSGFSEVDFDNALRKFVVERDSFLDELSFTAGTVLPSRMAKHPRAQKLKEEDAGSSLRPGLGSIRRKLSYRDMGSMKRQPSMARTGEQTISTILNL